MFQLLILLKNVINGGGIWIELHVTADHKYTTFHVQLLLWFIGKFAFQTFLKHLLNKFYCIPQYIIYANKALYTLNAEIFVGD